MAVIHSDPLRLVASASLLSAPAIRPAFEPPHRTPLAQFPAFAFPLRHSEPSTIISISNASSRTPLRTPAANSSHNKKYVYPDPDPEFATYETNKFKIELRRKLSAEIETFGDHLDAVVEVCSQIFSEFLHSEYGGPETLEVEPFTDMMVALKDENLPGAAFATRAALLWAQNNVDRDWESWKVATKTAK